MPPQYQAVQPKQNSSTGSRKAFWLSGLQFLLCVLVCVPCAGQSAQSEPGSVETNSTVTTTDTVIEDVEQAISVRTSLISKRVCRETICFESRDEVWCIGARNNHCCPDDLSRISVSELVDGCWEERSLDDLASRHQGNESEKETVFYIHGNRTDDEWAIARGAQLYKNLFYHSNRNKPIRYVIWQWKSEAEIALPMADFDIKASRAVQLGATLSHVTQQLGNRKATLIGYSLGSQIILSALNCPVSESIADGSQFQVVLIAPVFECNFPDCAALTDIGAVRRTLVFKNSCDRVVKFAERSCSRKTGCCQDPLTKILNSAPHPLGDVEEYPLAGEVENKHSVINYTQAPIMKSAINELLHAGGVGDSTAPGTESSSLSSTGS